MSNRITLLSAFGVVDTFDHCKSKYASQCEGWDCDCEGQYCKPGSVGAQGEYYSWWKCVNKKWIKTTDPNIT